MQKYYLDYKLDYFRTFFNVEGGTGWRDWKFGQLYKFVETWFKNNVAAVQVHESNTDKTVAVVKNKINKSSASARLFYTRKITIQ